MAIGGQITITKLMHEDKWFCVDNRTIKVAPLNKGLGPVIMFSMHIWRGCPLFVRQIIAFGI